MYSCECRWPQKSEEGVNSPGAGVLDGCEPLHGVCVYLTAEPSPTSAEHQVCICALQPPVLTCYSCVNVSDCSS